MKSEVLIAFSGGVESVALLLKALRDGRRVKVVVIAAGGNHHILLAELITLSRILEWIGGEGYPGHVVETLVLPKCPFPAVSQERSAMSGNATQPMAVTLGMMLVKAHSLDGTGSVWIGWTKEDTSEATLSEWDSSVEDYGHLLNLPVNLGRVSCTDFSRTGFRAPLWEFSKAEILASIPEGCRKFLIPNFGNTFREGDRVVCLPSQPKVYEWENVGLKTEDRYEFYPRETSLFNRLVTGLAFYDDFDLPPSAQPFITRFNERLAKTIPLVGEEMEGTIKRNISSAIDDARAMFSS